MDTQQSRDGTGRWVYCCWLDKCEQFDYRFRKAGLAACGVFCLPPPVGELTLHDGLWEELNSKLGTLFDMAEEEEVRPELLSEMAAIIATFAQERYGDGTGVRTAQVGWQMAPEPGPVMAEMPVADLQHLLQELSAFMADAGRQGKPVILSL